MTNKKSFSDQVENPGFLCAKGRFSGSAEEQQRARIKHIRKLTGAIIAAIRNHGSVCVRSVGSDAYYNGGAAIADVNKKFEEDHDMTLLWSLKKECGNIGDLRSPDHVNNVVAYVWELKNFKDLEPEDAADAEETSG